MSIDLSKYSLHSRDLERAAYEGLDNVHRLIIEQSQAWFNRGSEWTIPVRDVAVLFLPWDQRLQPDTYKMLRFMHILDNDHWCRCIDIWLNILGQRGLETVDVRQERVRDPLNFQNVKWPPTGLDSIMETCRVEQCFIICKSSAMYKPDTSISHALPFLWGTEAQKQADVIRVHQALAEAVKLDFYEDLKRWHKEQYQYYGR